jgi:predicted O-linked N-acetylglucosamine transferase (SPINDLY family)
MSTALELKKIIINLINEFNAKNYELVIIKAKEIIEKNSDIPIVYNLLGASYSSINKHKEALIDYNNALMLEPDNEEILRNMGKSYSKLNEVKKAYECFEKASKIKPHNADAIFGMGLLHLNENQFQDSITKFNIAIEYNKSFSQAFYNLAIAQNHTGDFLQAQNSYIEAIRINKDYYQAYNNLGSLLIKTKKVFDAIKILEKVIKIKPKYIQALTNLGVAYLELKKYEDALAYLNSALSIDPFYVKAISQKLYLMRKICNWSEDKYLEKNLKLINNSNTDVTPWQLLSLDDDPKIEFIRAKKYGHKFGYEDFKSNYKNSKIKLAYFTSDFYEHAGMINMEGIFKYHDKNIFEVYAFDYGNFYKDSTHLKIKKYFDHFIYIDKLSDNEVNKIVAGFKIDIVIHRNGYSQNSRNSLFAKKIAPLQISFLGYPGTLGVNFIDYIIGDKTVIPRENRQFFSEKIIYMPNTYYPANNEREISKKIYKKTNFNIPEDSFVFGSFNNSYKISIREFLIWMKLLAKIKNSYLILLVSDEITKENLINEIIKHNEDPRRIKFLSFVNNKEHLARHQLIDLYLDTFNYNGHTSVVDALYSGVPVVTKKGKSFTSRVCASILKSINMHKLITNNEDEYFNLIFEIATKKEKYNKIKLDIESSLKSSALFNTKKYVKDLERGYQIAFENKVRHNKVEHIEV